ncbi:hypothetical protein CAOG_06999 [Capsaspora owczarzaki ATCC 30864]|uniref:SAM domain-containing protein n=1 Tax=Capsaspora owczarzaki (strain ATCC 30864) TaxID=595528 RepID=A0A0D2X4V6_CAPO3|nr:hypothetical protein CAOG_06999 [Capsaspora owczarzaki ATCC 30864]KJE96724.1 hypothetical protein, variant [Capsaspora owczarzaki ATCC 30864]|eukprot:XP_004343723.1 hypothetical protein CAOG_06999 [Capsaspora owczarzaki ATCC 30864]
METSSGPPAPAPAAALAPAAAPTAAERVIGPSYGLSTGLSSVLHYQAVHSSSTNLASATDVVPPATTATASTANRSTDAITVNVDRSASSTRISSNSQASDASQHSDVTMLPSSDTSEHNKKSKSQGCMEGVLEWATGIMMSCSGVQDIEADDDDDDEDDDEEETAQSSESMDIVPAGHQSRKNGKDVQTTPVIARNRRTGARQPLPAPHRIKSVVHRIFQFLTLVLCVSFLPHSYFSLFVGVPDSSDGLGWFVLVLVFVVLPTALLGFLPLVFFRGFLTSPILPLIYIGGISTTYFISVFAVVDATSKLDDPHWPSNQTSALQELIDSVFGKVDAAEARGGQEARRAVGYFNIAVVGICSLLAAYFAISSFRVTSTLCKWRRVDINNWLNSIGMQRYAPRFHRHKLNARWFLSDNTAQLNNLHFGSLTDRHILEDELARLRMTIQGKARPPMANLDLAQLDIQGGLQRSRPERRSVLRRSLSVASGGSAARLSTLTAANQLSRQAMDEMLVAPPTYSPLDPFAASSSSVEQQQQQQPCASASTSTSATIVPTAFAPLPAYQQEPTVLTNADLEAAQDAAYLKRLAPDEAVFNTANARLRHLGKHKIDMRSLSVKRVPAVLLVMMPLFLFALFVLVIPMFVLAYLSDPTPVVGTARVLLVPTLVSHVVAGGVLVVMILGRSPSIWIAFDMCLVSCLLHTGIVVLMLIESSGFVNDKDYAACVIGIMTALVLLVEFACLLTAVRCTARFKATVRNWPVELVALWAASNGLDYQFVFRHDITGLALIRADAVELVERIGFADSVMRKLFEQRLAGLQTCSESFDCPVVSPELVAGAFPSQSALACSAVSPAFAALNIKQVTASSELRSYFLDELRAVTSDNCDSDAPAAV